MGFLDKLLQLMRLKKKEFRVLVLGLNNSGKSTLIQLMKGKNAKAMEVVPTVGFNIERFKHKGVTFTGIDMSGQGRYREIWDRYYKDCDAILFVIDSTDKVRLPVVKDELDQMYQHTVISSGNVPVVFFANKKDMRDAIPSARIVTALQLERLNDRHWHICATNAITGDGVSEGMDWLCQELNERGK